MQDQDARHAHKLFGDSTVFSDIPLDIRGRLAEKARFAEFPAGAFILRKGEHGASIMLLVSGRVKITCVSPSGSEMLLNIINPNDVFGEIALLDGAPRSADAIAVVESRILVIDSDDITPLLQAVPTIATKLIDLLCQRVRITTALAEDVVFLDLEDRLRRRILSLAEQYGRQREEKIQIEHGLSQQELADSLGASRESVNKVLSRWRKQGIVTLSRGSITVSDLQLLKDTATTATP